MENIELIKENITNLESEKNDLELRLNVIHKELIKLRQSCEHKNVDGSDALVYNSTNMHNDFYKCKICNKIIKK